MLAVSCNYDVHNVWPTYDATPFSSCLGSSFKTSQMQVFDYCHNALW